MLNYKATSVDQCCTILYITRKNYCLIFRLVTFLFLKVLENDFPQSQTVDLTTSVNEGQLPLSEVLNQGIIDSTRTKTFAKKPKFTKLLRKLKSTPVRCH